MVRCIINLWQLLPTLIPATLIAQSAGWNTYIGGTEYDGARAMVRANDGGIVLAGYTGSFGPNASNQTTNCYVVKVDDEGTLLWTRFFGGNYSDELYGAAMVSDGGILVAGFTRTSTAPSSEDILLARLSADGDLLWAKHYGSSNVSEYALDLTALGGDQFVLTGYMGPDGQPTGSDAIIMKVDADGNVIWTNRSGTYGNDDCKAVAHSSDDGIIVAGLVQTGGPTLDDAWIAKLDASGQVVWSNTYSAPENNGGSALVTTPDGGALVTGQGLLNNIAGVVASKVDSDGAVSWSYRYNFIAGEGPSHVLATTNGNYLITGTAIFGSPTAAHRSNYMIDNSGVLIAHSIQGWVNAGFTGASCLENQDQTFTFDGQVNLSGFTQSADLFVARSGPFNYGMADGCMMNLTSGETSAPYAYSGISANPPMVPVTWSPIPLVWTSGSDGSPGSFCSTVGIERPIEQSAGVFPSPCDRSFHLDLGTGRIPTAIAIIDPSGRTIWAQDQPQQISITIDASAWPEGIYCIRMFNDPGSNRSLKLAVSHH